MSQPLPRVPTLSSARFLEEVKQLPCPRLESMTQYIQRLPDMEWMESAIATIVQQSLTQAKPLFVPRGAFLFFGPAGSGKTTITGLLAHGWAKSTDQNAKLVHLKSHELASGEHGQSQKNVGRMFDALGEICSSGEPVFVTTDEFESVATNRDEISGKTSPIDARNSVNALLERLDNRPRNLFLLATTNVSHYLDPAVVDRFDFHFFVRLPDSEARMNALSEHLKVLDSQNLALEKASSSQREDLIHLTEGYSFRGIERLVRTCVAIHRGILSPDIQQLLASARWLNSNSPYLNGCHP